MGHSPGLRLLTVVHGAVLVVAALYFARPILLPALAAVLVTFLLRPAVVWLERRRLPRVVCVLLVVGCIVAGLAGVGWLITSQLHGLALHLDEYRGHLQAKLSSVQGTRSEALENVRNIAREATEALQPGESGEAPTHRPTGGVEPGRPLAVGAGDLPSGIAVPESVVPPPAPPRTLTGMLGTMVAFLSTPLAMALLAGVLVVFMLMNFEDLRNRVLRLSGQGKLTLTTRTLDDMSRRLSRFLTTMACVNAGFGVVIFCGLWLIGVDHAPLWGLLACVSRFVPFVGAIAAFLLPMAMAIVQFPDWLHPVWVAVLFLVVELLTNNVVEPLAYGRTAGVSAVALLISAAFWAWLWGPFGLILAVPMTVFLAVLGKHVPQFGALAVLLGDEPALAAHEVFYQRLLAGDADEAAELFEDQLAARGRAEVCEDLVIPALALAERDRYQGRLEESDKEFVWQNARELIEGSAADEPAAGPRRVRVVACAAQDLADELAVRMLRQLAPADCDVQIAGSELMVSEKVGLVTRAAPDAVIVSAVGPGGAAQVRYLCKRLRQEAPRVRLIVGRWDFQGDRERLSASLKARGADHVCTRLWEALDLISRIQPLPLSA